MANMLQLFEKANIKFVALKDNIDTSSKITGKFIIYMMSICAEIERDNISEYVAMAKKQNFMSNKHTAISILGYDIKDKKMVVNEEEAKIVKFIFNTYSKTRNYYKTAVLCNEKGFRGKRGHQFHASSIITILKNETYCGYNKHHSEKKKAAHKAIISKSLYNKVNNIEIVA